jgi:hypothetical protein
MIPNYLHEFQEQFWLHISDSTFRISQPVIFPDDGQHCVLRVFKAGLKKHESA